ncbi:MAG: hypothetical protein HYV07_00510 [Deltaproteobacteria bacterium]|nr:hypothetical protein [Deltaproteobacteria bacterium]
MRVPVTLRFYAESGATVEVLGDFPSFRVPHPMTEVSPGLYERELLLEPGVYRYKLRVDGRQWRLDPSAPTENVEGHENNLLVVAGAEPPLVFAPDRRHVSVRPDGILEVFAESEVGTEASEHFWVECESKAQPLVRSKLVHAGAYGGKQLLRGRVERLAARPRTMGFDAQPGRAFPIEDLEASEPPSWVRNAVFYGIFVDRWFRGRMSPVDPRCVPRRSPSSAATSYGGDLDGIRESIPDLAKLGVTALVLTPITPSPSVHRYDSVDLMSVDRALGGEDALARLLDTARARGLRVVVDASFTHVHETHPGFVDLLARKKRSAFVDWFQILSMPVRRRDPSTYRHYPGGPGLPLLRLDDGPAREHVLEAAERWVARGVDGLRLDAMDDAPRDLWRELRARVKQKNQEFLLLGEVVTDRLHPHTGSGGADIATDFMFREHLVDFFARDRVDAAELWARLTFLAHRLGPAVRGARLLFLDNHDTPRFRSLAVSHDRHRMALAFLLFMRDPVWLTYGAELGMAGGSPEARREDVWPERLPMSPPGSPRTRELIEAMAKLRRTLDPSFDPIPLELSRGFLALERKTMAGRKAKLGKHRVICLQNRGPQDQPVAHLIPETASLVLEINGRPGDPREPLAPMSGRIVSVPVDNREKR